MQQPDTQGWWVPECRQPHSCTVSCGLNLLTSSSCSIWAPSSGTECKDVAELHGNSQDLLPYRTDNQGLPQTMDKLEGPCGSASTVTSPWGRSAAGRRYWCCRKNLSQHPTASLKSCKALLSLVPLFRALNASHTPLAT